MLKPRGISPSPSHEDLFIQRYQWLMGFALQLTEHQRASAEDLVHDAFIQFTLHRPDLQKIENIEGYLYRMLRNMHLSQVRRLSHTQSVSLSVVDYDSAEIGLRVSDHSMQLQVREDLHRICHYACVRSETSQIGSILILRFFHGYYPGEIALLIGRDRRAVDDSLRIARREAKLYLEHPARLKFMANQSTPEFTQPGEVTGNFLVGLREQIFMDPRGECLKSEMLNSLYTSDQPAIIDSAMSAHLVSCHRCLDEVNRVLNLPPLSERFAMDTVGRDSSSDNQDRGDRGGSSGPSGGAAAEDFQRGSRRRFRDLIEHRPQQLMISVNGFIVGSQKVGAQVNEQTINVNMPEQIRFVEVFSEQWLRLSFLEVEHPTDGEVEQRDEVEFNDGRNLGMSLRFGSPWPTLHVRYHDPALIPEGQSPTEQVQSATEQVQSPTAQVQSPKSKVQSRRSGPTGREGVGLANTWGRFTGFIRKLTDFGPWTLDFGLFFRPGTVTALFALALILIAVVVYRPVPTAPVSAADLLQKAAASEEALANNRDQVLHRTLRLEQKSSSGQMIASQRIEVWHSAEKGITARRLYDASGSLVAGDWRRADGVQTLYHHGRRPELRTTADERTSTPINFDSVWQLDPTAKEFVSLIGGSQNAKALETANTYVVSYGNVNVNSPGLISASLVLGRADLHAIEQVLVIREGDEVREYKITETSFERRRADSVAPAVFEPEPELLSATELETRNSKLETSSSPLALGPSPVMATAALEVEVIEALNNANAFTGEPIEVSRSADGRITVTGMVETDQRKRDLLAALTSVRNNPAVHVKIETVAEAQARAKSEAGRLGQTSVGEVQRFEVTEGQNPAYTELRKRFSEAEARRFADSVLSRIQSARSHARAMKQISQRFSQSDLQSLTPGERARWLALIRRHAETFVRETESVRRDLQQFFPEASAGTGGGATISGDAELQAKIRELFDASGTIERGLNQSLALTAGANNASPVKSSAFWRQFANAVGMARSIAAAK